MVGNPMGARLVMLCLDDVSKVPGAPHPNLKIMRDKICRFLE